jgi:hypothetical protein
VRREKAGAKVPNEESETEVAFRIIMVTLLGPVDVWRY